MLFDFNANGGKGGLGSVGVGGLIQSAASYKSDLQGLNDVKKFLETYGDKGLETVSFTSGTAVSKLSNESKELLQTWKTDGANASTIITNIDERVDTLEKTGSKSIQTFKKFGSTLLNGFISLAASAAISLAIQGIQNLINSYKDLAEESSKIAQEFNNSKTQIDDYSARIEELRGVMENEESTTQEVKDATSELYEIQSDLIGTYGAYHDGIDLVNGDLSTQLELLQQINKENAQKAVNDINANRSALSSGTNIGANYLQSLFLTQSGAAGSLFAMGKMGKKFYENLSSNQGVIESFKNAWTESDLFGNDAGLIAYKTSAEQIMDMYENFNAKFKSTNNDAVNNLIDSFKEFEVNGDFVEVSGSVDDVSTAVIKLQTQLKSLGYYNEDLNNQLTKIANDATQVAESTSDAYNTILYNDVISKEDLNKYYNSITDAYNAYKDAQKEGDTEKVAETTKSLKEIYSNLFSDTKIEAKYVEYFEELYPDIQALISNWKFEAEIVPTIKFDSSFAKQFKVEDFLRDTSLEELNARYQKLITSGTTGSGTMDAQFRIIAEEAEKAGYSVKEFLSLVKQMDTYSDKYSSLRNIMGNFWKDDYADDFTDEEIAIAAEIEPEFSDKQLNYDEIKEEISKRLSPVEVEIKPQTNYSEQISDLDKMEDAFGGLSTAYDTSQTGDKVSASDLEQVSSDMGGVTFDVSGEDVADINALSNALEKYNEELIKNAGNTEATQTAANKLATAYVDQSGVLDQLLKDVDNVDESYKQYVIDQLKAQGITNAEEVVNSRLTKQYKAQASALTTLSKKVAQYRSKLDQVLSTGEDYENVTDNIKDEVTNLLKVYNDAGEEITELTPDIDSEFIVSHLDDIYAALEGDVDAVGRLRAALAEDMMAEVGVDINDDQAVAAYNELVNLVSNLDASEYCINGEMDTSAISAKLEELMQEAGIAADKIDSVLRAASGGTISANTEWEEVELKVPDITTVNYNSDLSNWANGKSNTTKTEHNISWKTIKYKMPKKTTFNYSNSAAGANYGGGGGSNSGGSGGGDGSNSSSNNTKTEDDKEIYDWIEKYIENLEDALDKLDDKVNDTYDNWVNRNKNVGKEIDNLNEQIKANTDAAKYYKDYADKKVKVNNGETKVKDSDYGDDDTEQKTYDQSQLDKAIEEWKTGKYQKLIQQGKLSADAIETIQNTYLKETIENYKTWWEKSKDASDKATSLAYTLKSKYQDIFNNIKDDYDEMIDLIEKRTDLVQKNIDRMQEEGHFVNEKYYKQQLKLNAEVEAQQRKELENMKKAYNDAIKTGKIDKDSEAARSMLSDIYSKAADLGETLNEAIKIKNDIRQLGWDKFDWLEERMARINAEAEHFQNILSHYKQVDDLGNFTDEGWANLAMDYTNYEADQEALERYKAEYENLRKELAKDPTDQEVISRLEDTQSKIWELEESSLDAVENMKSKLNEAFDANLKHLNETIDKYKEALQDAKDLFSYQKNIESQTNNIMKLEKQMAAYRGDTSEAGRKKQVELQQKYNDAQEQLRETEWDKYISETGELLDDLYEDYEKLLTGYLDNFQNILGDVKVALQNNPTNIAEAMKTRLSEWDQSNTKIGQNLTNISTAIGGLNASITTALTSALLDAQKSAAEGNTAKNENGTVTITVNKDGTISIATNKYTEPTTGSSNGNSNTSQGSITEVAPDPNQKLSTISSPEEEKAAIEANKREEQEEIARQNKLRQQQEAAEAAAKAAAEKKERAKKWINGTFYDANGDVKYKGGAWRQDDTGWWYRYTDKDGNEAWLASATHTIDGVKYTFNADGYWNGGSVEAVPVGISSKNATTTKKTKKKTTKKKAKGDKHIAYSGIYETNEADTGTELIYKTQSGGILTPLDAGDMVFTNEMSKRLWDIAANNIPTGGTVQMVNLPTNINGGTVNTNADISITLPNVTNYTEFKKELQNDDNFEKFIKEITVGQLNGNNTLKKRKY